MTSSSVLIATARSAAVATACRDVSEPSVPTTTVRYLMRAPLPLVAMPSVSAGRTFACRRRRGRRRFTGVLGNRLEAVVAQLLGEVVLAHQVGVQDLRRPGQEPG